MLLKGAESHLEEQSLILRNVLTHPHPFIKNDILVRLRREIGDFDDGKQPDHKFHTLVILAGDAAQQLLDEREELPSLAERLLYWVLSKEQREAIPGDLEEEFRTIILPKFGRRYARMWYWKQVLTSAWPLVRGLAYRLAAGTGVWKAIEAFRRIDF